MRLNKLKLNDQKIEVLLCGPPARRDKVPVDCLPVGDTSISFSRVVKTLGLGVLLDYDLSFNDHISPIVRACLCHVGALSQILPYLTCKAANAMDVTLTVKLDYCNSLYNLSGQPLTQIKHLQAVQNAAARVVAKSIKRDYIKPVLKELHGLPVADRMQKMILSTVYRSMRGSAPLYLSELVPTYTPARRL